MQLNEAVTDFLTFEQYVRGVSPATTRLYTHLMGRFVSSAGKERALGDTDAAVERYLAGLGRRGYSDHYRAKAFAVLRCFFRWAIERGTLRLNPMRWMRPPIVNETVKTFLKKAEVLRLLAAVRANEGAHAERDHAIYATMFYAGLRVGEIVRLRPEDVNLAEGWLSVHGKGGREANVPIHPELAAALGRWMRRRPEGVPWLFPSQARHSPHLGQLDVVRIEKVLRDVYAPAAGLAGRVTPHTLRRSFATELRRRGAPLEHVSRLLRHSCIQTTMTYLRHSPEGLRASVKRL